MRQQGGSTLHWDRVPFFGVRPQPTFGPLRLSPASTPFSSISTAEMSEMEEPDP